MIAISYRREDSLPVTGRLYDRLQAEFGKGNVFMDFDSIPYGVDFRDHIKQMIDRSKVLVAMIGPDWVGRRRHRGRRIDEPTDFVRLEIGYALERKLPIIPILVGSTQMPRSEELPKDIEALAFRNGLTLDAGIDFHHHAERLVGAINRILTTPPPSPPVVEPPQTPPTSPAVEKSLAPPEAALEKVLEPPELRLVSKPTPLPLSGPPPKSAERPAAERTPTPEAPTHGKVSEPVAPTPTKPPKKPEPPPAPKTSAKPSWTASFQESLSRLQERLMADYVRSDQLGDRPKETSRAWNWKKIVGFALALLSLAIFAVAIWHWRLFPAKPVLAGNKSHEKVAAAAPAQISESSKSQSVSQIQPSSPPAGVVARPSGSPLAASSVMSATPAPVWGTLKVDSTPQGAWYEVIDSTNQHHVGKTPETLENLPHGYAQVIFRREGFVDHKGLVWISANSVQSVTWNFANSTRILPPRIEQSATAPPLVANAPTAPSSPTPASSTPAPTTTAVPVIPTPSSPLQLVRCRIISLDSGKLLEIRKGPGADYPVVAGYSFHQNELIRAGDGYDQRHTNAGTIWRAIYSPEKAFIGWAEDQHLALDYPVAQNSPTSTIAPNAAPATPSIGPLAQNGRPWRERITDFVRQFVAVNQSQDPNATVAFYAPSVDYFGNRGRDHAFILRDVQKYNALWPARHDAIDGDIDVDEKVPNQQYQAGFKLNLYAENPKTNDWTKGQVATTLDISIVDGAPKISAINQKRLQRVQNGRGKGPRPPEMEAALSPIDPRKLTKVLVKKYGFFALLPTDIFPDAETKLSDGVTDQISSIRGCATVSFSGARETVRSAYDDCLAQFYKAPDHRNVDYKVIRDTWFVISGRTRTTGYYTKGVKHGGDVFVMELEYEGRVCNIPDATLAQISHAFDGSTDAATATTTPASSATVAPVAPVAAPMATPAVPPQIPTDNTISDDEVKSFINTHYQATERKDLDYLLSQYNDIVDYNNDGRHDRAFIRNGYVSYFNRWPTTSFTVGDIHVVRSPIQNAVTAYFEIRYFVRDIASNRSKQGRADETWTISKMFGALKIVSEKETVHGESPARYQSRRH